MSRVQAATGGWGVVRMEGGAGQVGACRSGPREPRGFRAAFGKGARCRRPPSLGGEGEPRGAQMADRRGNSGVRGPARGDRARGSNRERRGTGVAERLSGRPIANTAAGILSQLNKPPPLPLLARLSRPKTPSTAEKKLTQACWYRQCSYRPGN